MKNGVAFFQETHSIESDILLWKKEWNGNLFINHGTSNSKGVMIALSSELECEILKYDCDEEGRLQILSLNYENEKFLLVNIYNENTEQKQIDLIIKLLTKLENFGELGDHKLIFGGDWNFIFNIDLDANRGSPTLKRKTIAEVIKLSEKYDLLDIFRIRNPEKRRFSFRQPTPKLQRRLDFFLISNELQESVKK